jgi:hypothetical protein
MSSCALYQPAKVHVTSEGCYVIITGNIRVNRMTGQLEGSNVKML